MMYLSVAGGLFLLLLCGDLLVRGAVGLAARAGIQPLVIALTIVALGTSAPELVISADAALRGAPGIALGNVIGSNIANILLVLGLPALIHPIPLGGRTIRLNARIMLGASLLLIGLCALGSLGRADGLLLISLLAAYLVWSASDARRRRLDETLARAAQVKELVHGMKETGELVEAAVGQSRGKPEAEKTMPWLVAGTLVVVGGVGLSIGADILVKGATAIARAFSMPETAIGLSLIAVGTSLPELSTSLMAAWRRQYDVAIGNVVGSNIVNILGILGIASLISPLPVATNFLHADLWVMLLAALAVVPTIAMQGSLTRWNGAAFVLAYAIYLFAILHRGSGLT